MAGLVPRELVITEDFPDLGDYAIHHATIPELKNIRIYR